MGTVWLAEHLTLGCEVAVKVLRGDQLSVVQRSRFAREAKLAARIKSPYVVRIFDYGLRQNQPYIVMERLQGETLAQRLEAQRTLAPALVRQLGMQLCAALEQAHLLGVVHRDLKPHNVFLVRGRGGIFAKLLDFGIAKLAEAPLTSVTKTGTLVGTPRYMSPEQLLNAKGVDAQADLWALAATLYEALTGGPLFNAKALGRLWQQIDRAEYVAPSMYNVALGAAVDAWFAKALQRDKSKRFADASSMARALDEALAPHATSGASITPQRSLMAASWDDAENDVGAATVADEALASTTPGLAQNLTLSRPLHGDVAALNIAALTTLAAAEVSSPPHTSPPQAVAAAPSIFTGAATVQPPPRLRWVIGLLLVGLPLLLWWRQQAGVRVMKLHASLPVLTPMVQPTVTVQPPLPVVPRTSPPEVSAEPTPPRPAPTSVNARWRPTVATSAVAPTPVATVSTQLRPRADRCKEALVADEHGVLHPRLECLQQK